MLRPSVNKRSVILTTVVLLGIALLVWLSSVGVRVARIKKSNRERLETPIGAWTPPEDLPPRTLPDTSRVDWLALSNDVDANGVYVVDYDRRGQRGVSGVQHNPFNIATFGIYNVREYRTTGETAHLQLALRQFDYLFQRVFADTIDSDTTAVWCAEFDLGYQYNARAPWRSAYFQVRCMNAMLWATWLTGDPRFAALAETSLPALGHKTSDGGLAYETGTDGLFFQEVVTTPLHHILNGNINALVGLYYYHDYTGSDDAWSIFQRGVRGTSEFLPFYDKYGYSLYSLSPKPGIRNHFNIANANYHHLHVAQLRTLYHITEDPIFRDYADKWEKESNGVFDVAWTALWVMFKDAMRVKKTIL